MSDWHEDYPWCCPNCLSLCREVGKCNCDKERLEEKDKESEIDHHGSQVYNSPMKVTSTSSVKLVAFDRSIKKGQVVMKRSKQTKNSIVSFFAGCGGLDLGFLGGFDYKNISLPPLPFKIVAAYDFNDKCISTYHENIGNHAEVKDLEHINPSDLPKADVLIGGFPCQDFSSCGPKAGLNSKRGRLYQNLVNYMIQHKPKVVIAENVPHLARIGAGEVIKTIVKDLENAGYRFDVWNLFAPDYGIPQRRARLFFVGVRQDIEGMPTKPKPTHAENHRSINWAIKDLETVLDESIPNQSQYFKASRAKKGNGQGDEKSKTGLPSYTIRANAKSRVQFHYKLPRRLTVRECARLQTFPDGFVFPHSATTNIMQIGNAVPPLLAYHVARAIALFMKKINDKD